MRLGDIINGSPAIQELLRKSKDDTKSLRTIREKEKSLFYAGVRSESGPRSTIGSAAGSIIGDEEFTFDTQLVNTAAYRRVLRSHQRAASDQGQSSQDSGPSASASGSRPSRPSLARLFGKLEKKEEAATSPHLTGKSVSTGRPQGSKNETRLVEPISEHIVRDYEHGLATVKDIRDAISTFYDVMALHREILAMKFVDKSYEGVLEKKVRTRDGLLSALRGFCAYWDTENKFDGTDERRVVGELASVLLPRLSTISRRSLGRKARYEGDRRQA